MILLNLFQIEEDLVNRDTMQDFIDELEYMVECTEAENENADKFDNLLDDPKFYECIKRHLDRSPAEVLLVILTFALDSKLPFNQILMLVRMINALLNESILPESKYLLDKIFNNKDHCEFHAICPDCEIYVGRLKDEKDSVSCQLCAKKMDLTNPSCLVFFLILDPSQYISDYLQQNEDYYDEIMSGKYRSNGSIKDIYDGQLYKNFLQS